MLEGLDEVEGVVLGAADCLGAVVVEDGLVVVVEDGLVVVVEDGLVVVLLLEVVVLGAVLVTVRVVVEEGLVVEDGLVVEEGLVVEGVTTVRVTVRGAAGVAVLLDVCVVTFVLEDVTGVGVFETVAFELVLVFVAVPVPVPVVPVVTGCLFMGVVVVGVSWALSCGVVLLLGFTFVVGRMEELLLVLPAPVVPARLS